MKNSRSTSGEFSSPLEELIDRGLDDLLKLEEVVWVTSRHLGLEPLDEGVVGPALATVSDLLERRFAVVGNLYRRDDGLLGVRAWELDPDAAVARIERNWGELYRPENLDDQVWFELTEAGREQARRNQAGA